MNMTDKKRLIRVGSRKSQLALVQTENVITRLKAVYQSCEFEIVSMTTTGDNILDTALSKIGEKSLFTKELETALLDNRVDLVVHSLKDLPTELPPGLVIGAVCKRDDPRDALVLRAAVEQTDVASLPAGSVIGTSSLRRAAQLRRKFPQLQIFDVRGNLNTRLRKLDEESSCYTGLVLAIAGLERMKWNHRISHIFSADECMYAVGQGAMAVECRAGDVDTLDLVSVLTDYTTALQCITERSFLRRLEGGCSVPVAVSSELSDGKLTMTGGVFSIAGDEAVIDTMSTNITTSTATAAGDSDSWHSKYYTAIVAPPSLVNPTGLYAAERLGITLAEKLMAAGAAEILAKAKKETAEEILRQKAAKQAMESQTAQ